MLKAVIYDMDDLMVNSMCLHEVAWDRLFSEHGFRSRDLPDGLRAGFAGMRVIDILRSIKDYLKLDAGIEDLYKHREAIFMELARTRLEAMQGLLESLELFKKNRMRIALASSGTKDYINLVLDKFNISKYFEVIVSGDDVSKGKPDPETYIVAADKLGLRPGECVVLEDATKGVLSAKAAGCRCIAIANTNNPAQDLSNADIRLNSLNEINIDVLESLEEKKSKDEKLKRSFGAWGKGKSGISFSRKIRDDAEERKMKLYS